MGGPCFREVCSIKIIEILKIMGSPSLKPCVGQGRHVLEESQ